ncbi:hypothetical protein KY092_16935 [Natronomonas gomsonensis]|uniref:DUF7551 domain-containing protein n=1 Tax=Natronomonas gomsonensis TaxID=1046043 RepID=UPI0020CA785F|nr:hypothetical protein [Natronomonas gomsonensis]MCY4732241.1 hypothetical protein [Natronomonas gomsonensis]
MIGTTLGDIRDHIESLASEDGRYYVACARTGCRPVPADELAFDSRASARAAAQATEQYRATLRRYDPQVSYRDIIVREELPGWEASDGTPLADRTRELPPTPPERGGTDAIEFCHTVASVVFEAIAGSAHGDLQDAIMDTYLDAAEAVASPDELCLRLLESIATELDERLAPEEQAAVLREAAANLPRDDGGVLAPEPLAETLDSLEAVGLVDDYRIERCSAASGGESRSWTVCIEGYSLDGTPGRVVTLPLVVQLFDRLATRSVTISGAERVEGSGSWRLSIETNTTGRVGGLACVSTEGCP